MLTRYTVFPVLTVFEGVVAGTMPRSPIVRALGQGSEVNLNYTRIIKSLIVPSTPPCGVTVVYFPSGGADDLE